jgi:hypothetical protein
VRLGEKYSFNREINDDRIRKETILLPVNSERQPDYAFMEEYMRELEKRKIEEYKAFISKKLEAITGECGKLLIINELQNKKWREFVLGNEFDIIATQSGIDKINLNRKRGNNPYITRTENNNGIDCFICKQENSMTDKSNVITIGLDTQTAFYQPTAFYTGQNIQVLSNIFLNKYIALFLKPLIIKQMDKFNWGGNGATLTRLRRTKILLPVNSEGQLDYAYMEKYMQAKEREMLASYLEYLKKKKN